MIVEVLGNYFNTKNIWQMSGLCINDSGLIKTTDGKITRHVKAVFMMNGKDFDYEYCIDDCENNVERYNQEVNNFETFKTQYNILLQNFKEEK